MKNQVKVTKTENHKDSQKGETIVCRGKLIVRERLREGFNHNILKPIIISETEKVENNDVLYDGKELLTCGRQQTLDAINNVEEKDKSFFKVLALSENFSPKQLQSIVDGKLKDGDEVFVECEIYQRGTKIYTSYTIKFNKDNHITLLPAKKEFTKAEQEAIKRFQNGEKFSVSTFIDEDTIVAGYGQLDHESNPYDFQFPLPAVYINAIYGTTSWDKWMKREDEKRISGNNMKMDFVTPENFKIGMRAAYWHGDMMQIEKKTSQEEFEQWCKEKFQL